MSSQDLVGQRIKVLRRQRGLSQAQLAHPELSDSYVSLIESGKRTPTPAVLELLAQKLDCSLTYLVNGVTAEQMEELEIGLRFAKIAVENGDLAEARSRYAEIREDRSLAGLSDLKDDADYGYALAVEACGERAEAIAVLQRLYDANEPAPSERQAAVAVALCRCYRDEGSYSKAVATGERVLAGSRRPAWTDGLVELGATLLSVYMFRGDSLRASQFAGELLSAAEALGTPRSIVAACWNGAVLAERLGRMDEAIGLIERALAVQSETGDGRNLARLRARYGMVLVRTRPADPHGRETLLRAKGELHESSASVLDLAMVNAELARAAIAAGDREQAVGHAREGIALAEESRDQIWAELHMILGQALLLLDERDEAAAALAVAAQWFDAEPMPNMAANWLTIADAQERMGDYSASVQAASRALASVGL